MIAKYIFKISLKIGKWEMGFGIWKEEKGEDIDLQNISLVALQEVKRCESDVKSKQISKVIPNQPQRSHVTTSKIEVGHAPSERTHIPSTKVKAVKSTEEFLRDLHAEEVKVSPPLLAESAKTFLMKINWNGKESTEKAQKQEISLSMPTTEYLQKVNWSNS